MPMKAWYALLIPLLAVVLASPATLTVTLTGFGTHNFTKFWVYNEAGDFVASGSVTDNQFSFEYNAATSYIVKAEGDAITIFTIPANLAATTYTVNGGQLANVTVKVVFNGPGFKPSTVAYTVSIGTYPNVTATSGKTLFTAVPAVLTFPENLLFPAVYGYKLLKITVDGTEVATPIIDTAGQHTVEVTYEAAGLATVEPMMLFAGAGIIIVLIALAVSRRRGVQSAVAALRSPYLEQ